MRARREPIWIARDGTYGIARLRGRPAVLVSLASGASPELHERVLGRKAPPVLARAKEIDTHGNFFKQLLNERGKTVAQLGATRIGKRRSAAVVLHSFSISPRARQKGLGNALGRIVSQEAISRWNPKYVFALVDPKNTAVVRVCLNNGMRPFPKGKGLLLRSLARQKIYKGTRPPDDWETLTIMVRKLR
ncbi:hypothetical protein HYS54_04565 [Candidatus Micrarchaeota archaeon]|nr:hypothetical protein [Candidatus Micrarchaeota archaeon]